MPISFADSKQRDFASNFDSDRVPKVPRRRRRSPLNDSFDPSNSVNDIIAPTSQYHDAAGGYGQAPTPRPRHIDSAAAIALISTIIFVGMVFSGLIIATAIRYAGEFLRHSNIEYMFTPEAAKGDYSWIEYLPHVDVERFRPPPDVLNPTHRGLAAAWRVFAAHTVNVEWDDPTKKQPSTEESFVCFLEVNATHSRLEKIWDTRRGVDLGDEYPKLAPTQQPVLKLSATQLGVVGQVLQYAYRDALFLCMTPGYKSKYLGMLEAGDDPDPTLFFELHVSRYGPVKPLTDKEIAGSLLQRFWYTDVSEEIRGLEGLELANKLLELNASHAHYMENKYGKTQSNGWLSRFFG